MGFLDTEHYGHTAPLSMECSSKEDLHITQGYDELIETTKEGKEESQLRERVLSWLDALVKRWVAKEALDQGYKIEDSKRLGGRIYTFGSYRLGVHGPGADIDTLVLVPRHVTREMFFSGLHDELKAHISRVTELVAVPDAAVPVMKLKVDGLSLDLLFASLDVSAIPNNFEVLEDEVLKGVDAQTQRSLNGTRVATQMLKCVPNVATFRNVLRGIKRWAANRGVYGNVYGYPGGVAWAILVARVCQLYPNMDAASVFLRFFTFHKNWWKPDPEFIRNPNNPIYLTKTLEVDSRYGFKVWNRRVNASDRYDVFPVITPCYPYMNACYNCTLTTLRTIVSEFERADRMITENGSEKVLDFNELMAPLDFFQRYTTYLRIVAEADDVDTGRKWAGFIESRMRRFLVQLELIRGLRVHLIPRDWAVENPADSGEGGETVKVTHNWFIGLDTSQMGKCDIPLNDAWDSYMSHVTGPVASAFKRMPGMFEPRLLVHRRKDLLEAIPFALDDKDKEAIPRLLQQQKKDRKRKREEQKEKEPAEKERSRSGSAPPKGDSAALPPTPPSPEAMASKPVQAPSPVKPPDSPAFRPTEAFGKPSKDIKKTSSAARSPSKCSAGTPKKKSLTDQLIADSYM